MFRDIKLLFHKHNGFHEAVKSERSHEAIIARIARQSLKIAAAAAAGREIRSDIARLARTRFLEA